MDLYIMKKEAMEKLKNNLDLVYTKYYTEEDNKWLWDICDGEPFEKFKSVLDFELAPLKSDLSLGEIEFENCKIIYNNLSFLTDSQASKEELWAGLCHSTFYQYTRLRWGYDKGINKDNKNLISNIKSRFFFANSGRGGLYRNTLAKCWWVGKKTFQKDKKNQFERLDILGSNDISTKISDIFNSNNFSSNETILNGIIEGIKFFNNEGVTLSVQKHLRPALQYLNSVGGSIILDCLDEEEISAIFIDNVQKNINKNEKSIEFEDYEDYEESKSNAINDNKVYVSLGLGQEIIVKINSDEKNKRYKIDYSGYGKNKKIPALIEQFIGKTIDDEINFKGDTYKILNIAV